MRVEIKNRYDDETIKIFDDITGVSAGLNSTFLFESEIHNILYPKSEDEYIVLIKENN